MNSLGVNEAEVGSVFWYIEIHLWHPEIHTVVVVSNFGEG